MIRRLASAALGASLTGVVGLGVVAAIRGLAPLHLALVACGGVVALAALLWLGEDGVDPLAVRFGAVGLGVLALGAELAGGETGIGLTQTVILVVAAAMAGVGPWVVSRMSRPLPSWAIAIGLVAVGTVLVLTVIEGGPLGHDESAYAVKARSWLYGTHDGGWTIHRAMVPSLVAAAVIPASDSAVALRLMSAVISLLTVVAVWWLGRTLKSNRVGFLAAGLFAIAPSFLRRGAEFLTDVPATGLLLVVAVLLWKWLDRGARDRYLMGAVAVGAVSIYTRYQAAIALLLLALAGALLFWPRVRASGPAILRAAGLGLLLLLPHFIYATSTTGTPWGIFIITGEIAGRQYLGEGFVDYARDFPYLLAGPLGALAILIALAWGGYRLLALRRGGTMGPVDRATFYCLIPALGQFLFLGIVSHGEPRFMFFTVALLFVVTGIAGDEFRKRVPRETYNLVANLTAGAMAVFLLMSGTSVDRNAEARGDGFEVLEQVGAAVVASSQGECGIVTTYTPQLNWYSGCRVIELRDDRIVDLRPPDVNWYLVLFENGKRQPEGEILDGYLQMTGGDTVRIPDPDGGIGDATIWRFRETG
jgi:4-amino-4-deoxy-L-arabinose transferase-like glycosyltransferase